MKMGYVKSFLADNETIWLNVSHQMNEITARNINYFSCYDIQLALIPFTKSSSVCGSHWNFFRPFFSSNETNTHEMVPYPIVLITFTVIKCKDVNWLLTSCKDIVIKRFFLSVCSVCAGKVFIGQKRPMSEDQNS